MYRWVALWIGVAAASCVERDTDTAHRCPLDFTPSCGDGSIDGLEECDSSSECDACQSTAVPTTLFGLHGLSPVVIAADGSSLAQTQFDEPERFLRRFSTDGTELWSTLLAEDALVGEVALDAAGHAYAAGSKEQAQPHPWLSSWDVDGTLRWAAEHSESGRFQACAADEERVAAAGSQGEAEDGAGLLSVRDVDGVEVWTIIEPSLMWIHHVAFVDTEIAVTGVGVDRTSEHDDTKLLRYDENGATRWSVDLPEDGELSQRGFGIIADGVGGTWAFGEAALRPYAVHHDRDGNEIEVVACVGGVTGWVDAAALDPERRLSLGIHVKVQTPLDESHAWFPTIEDGVVVQAATFSNDSENSAGPLAVVWRDDGVLVLGWARYGDEGGLYSELVALAP